MRRIRTTWDVPISTGRSAFIDRCSTNILAASLFSSTCFDTAVALAIIELYPALKMFRISYIYLVKKLCFFHFNALPFKEVLLSSKIIRLAPNS